MSLPLYNRPYVELDFTRMAFDTRVSFSRSSTGTYFDANAAMQTAAVDVPRIDNDPASGSVLGLMTEAQRTNQLTYSGIETGVAGMLKSNVTDAAISWFGFLANGAYFGDNTIQRYAYRSNYSNPINVVHALSVFVKMDDSGVPVFGGTGSANDGALVIGGQVQAATTTKHLGSGIYRISGARSHTASNPANGVIKYTSNSARGFTISGYQLEAASSASSYIPTTTAAVTRSADAASFSIPARVVRLVTTYFDGATLSESVTPGATYNIPTGTKAIRNIRGYFTA